MICAILSHVEADIWVSVENRIDSISSHANYSLVVPEAKHIIGLSNPVFHDGRFSFIFATELGIRGPSIYKIGETTTALLTSTKDSMGDDMPSYFEDIMELLELLVLLVWLAQELLLAMVVLLMER